MAPSLLYLPVFRHNEVMQGPPGHNHSVHADCDRGRSEPVTLTVVQSEIHPLPRSCTAMPLSVDVVRPNNRLRLASFWRWCGQYWYRLDKDIEIPLLVDYAWCHRCEAFVEVEQLYTEDDIQRKVDDLVGSRNGWERLDAERARTFQEVNREMPLDLTCEARLARWSAALQWRRTRKSPPRCLECGSYFAIHVLPEGEEVPHPGDGGAVLVTGGDWCTGPLPDPIFFDCEGIRIK